MQFWKGYLPPLLLTAFLLVPLAQTRTAHSQETPTVVPCAIIPTRDGVRLSGHLFGAGEDAVILAHMYPEEQSQWYEFALFLSEQGYRVLTFDFRGFGESEGQMNVARNYRDIRAAISFLQDRGARNIYLIGASMGGTASLRAVAGRKIPGLRAVVTISSPIEILGLSVRSLMGEVKVPTLFLAAEDDGNAPADARWFYENTGGLKQLRLWPGYDHGTDLLRGDYSWQVQETILEFLERNRPATPAYATRAQSPVDGSAPDPGQSGAEGFAPINAND